MKHKIFIFLVVVFLGCSSLTDLSAATSAFGKQMSTNDGKKIVSVAYDDSESMKNNNNGKPEAYCNYAMQSFFSLFNTNDEIYLTYLSSPYITTDYSMANGKRQSVINDLGKHLGGFANPYRGVETAYEKISRVQGNENDQYWLIVFCDGNYSDLNKQNMSGDYLNDYFNMYANNKMPNGSDLNILFIAIGDNFIIPRANEDKNIYVIKVNKEEELIDAFDTCAQIILGYFEISTMSSAKMVKKTDNSFILSSDIKLKDIAFVIREPDVTITQFSNSDDQYTINDLHLEYARSAYIAHSKPLLGTASSIESSQFFEKGSYEVVFNKSIDIENIEVFIKPATEVKFLVYNSDSKELITDYTTIVKGEQLDIKFGLFETGTDQQLDPKLLTTNYTIYKYMNDKLDNEMSIENYIVGDKNNFELIYKFENGVEINKELSLDIYNLSFVEGPQNPSRLDVVGNAVELKFKLYKHDVPLTKQEIMPLNIKLEIDSPFDYDYLISEDGMINVRIYYDSLDLFRVITRGWLAVYRLPAKEYPITLNVSNTDTNLKISEPIQITLEKEPFIYTVLLGSVPFVFIIIVLGYFLKSRFLKGMKISRIELFEKDDLLIGEVENWQSEPLDKHYHHLFNYTNWLSFIPYIANRKYIGGILFIAHGNQMRKNNKVNVKKNNYECYLVDASEIDTYKRLALDKEIISTNTRVKEQLIELNLNDGFILKSDNKVYFYKLGMRRKR